MVINRLAKNCILEVLQKSRSEKTGSTVEQWQQLEKISVAIKHSKAIQQVQGVRKNIVYATGVTKKQGIVEGLYRLNCNSKIYYITDVKTTALSTVLSLVTEETY